MQIALCGGQPVRSNMLYYGKQTLSEEDIQTVLEVLTENKYLTTGPRVAEFEEKVCAKLGKKYAVAVSNGTAALHCAVACLDLLSGDEVIVTAISFAASANAILYCGGTPVFCDVEERTMNMDAEKISELITPKTRAIIAVDMCGQLCDYQKIRKICDDHGLTLIRDAAHSFGIEDVGRLADLTTFSFHPVKNITTGEGGMILTDNKEYYHKMRSFRCHGMDIDYSERKLHYYDIPILGYNYRLTDFQCALGLSQLRNLNEWVDRRRYIALEYDRAFADDSTISRVLEPISQVQRGVYHIYVIKLHLDRISCDRDTFFSALKAENIGVNVHYKPIYLLSLYNKLGYPQGLCPVAEELYDRIITLPLYPAMSEYDIDSVIKAVKKISTHFLIDEQS